MWNHDWYLYMQPCEDKFYRLNISKLLSGTTRPVIEQSHKSEADRDRKQVQRRARRGISWDVVTTIDSKLYILVSQHDYSYGRSTTSFFFRVYDPLHGLWKILPTISNEDSNCHLNRHFECGNKLIVFDDYSTTSYAFDTIEEKWMPALDLPPVAAGVEILGFLIGVEQGRSPKRIVAYKLDDENGLPESNSKHILDELWEIFYPPLLVDRTFLTRFGDDRVLLLSRTESNFEFILVAVFRVLISTVCGIPVVSAVFERKQLYDVRHKHLHDSSILSSFIMQDIPGHDHFGSLLDDLHLFPDNDDDATVPFHDDDATVPFHDDDDYGTGNLEDDNTKAQAFENKLMTDVKWDDGLKEKSLYFCFAENRTDSSVSYLIQAMKFRDLLSTSPHDSNSKLRQVASTSGYHLACLPRCGVFGSQILFAGGSEQDDLRAVQEVQENDDCFSPDFTPECDQMEPVDRLPSSRDIHFYDVMSTHSNIKRFSKVFKGMKPEPVFAEVEGKLYALAGYPKPRYMNPGPFFEVFDSIEKDWLPLPDPPIYTKFKSSTNCHAIGGTNIFAWGDEFPGVFRFDMAAGSLDKNWSLIKNSRVCNCGDQSDFYFQRPRTQQSIIAVDMDSIGDGEYILFTYKRNWNFAGVLVHLISLENDSFVCLPPLELPESVSSLLKAQDRYQREGHCSFVHLGGQRVCLVFSSPFSGPYSRSFYRLGDIDKMSILILVFEFEVTENRKSVAAEFVFHRMLDYDTDSCDIRNSRTSDTHMVGAFLL